MSNFYKEQIVLARRLGTSIWGTVKLVGFFRATVVRIYGKWLRTLKPRVGNKVLDVFTSSENVEVCKAEWTAEDLTAYYNAVGNKCFGAQN